MPVEAVLLVVDDVRRDLRLDDALRGADCHVIRVADVARARSVLRAIRVAAIVLDAPGWCEILAVLRADGFVSAPVIVHGRGHEGLCEDALVHVPRSAHPTDLVAAVMSVVAPRDRGKR